MSDHDGLDNLYTFGGGGGEPPAPKDDNNLPRWFTIPMTYAILCAVIILSWVIVLGLLGVLLHVWRWAF